jgi:predicted cupin superfamily sugar epimerase
MDHPSSTAEVVALFGLTPHTEGGYFRETYRASSSVVTRRSWFPGEYGWPPE